MKQAQLPRAAAALPHAGRAAPQRGDGRARRPDPRAAVPQDDAHIYLMESQIADEVAALRRSCSSRSTARSASSTRRKFATRPEQRIGDDALWDRAEARARGRARGARPAVRAQARRRRVLRPEDRLRRHRLASAASGSSAPSSSTTTRPSASTSTYIGEDNSEHRPVVIHRAIYGSLRALHRHPDRALRRRLPGLARARAGARHHGRRSAPRLRARGVASGCAPTGFRVELDESRQKLGAKIRDAQLAEDPVHAGRSATRRSRAGGGAAPHGGEDLKTMPLDAFVELLSKEGAAP